ncbi:cold-shock protein [Streptomyces zaomyceticus]|uniref:cold-shock protein n=1 Tax=Streptomyces zaomyceticus TaxID=68286 RepID=UPI0037A3EF3A
MPVTYSPSIDVLAHHSAINSTGCRELQEGQTVTVDVTQGQKGPRQKTSTSPDPPHTPPTEPGTLDSRRPLLRAPPVEWPPERAHGLVATVELAE